MPIQYMCGLLIGISELFVYTQIYSCVYVCVRARYYVMFLFTQLLGHACVDIYGCLGILGEQIITQFAKGLKWVPGFLPTYVFIT